MNFLKRDFLHLPMYAWLAGAGAFLVALLYLRSHVGANTSTTSAGVGLPNSATPTGFDTQSGNPQQTIIPPASSADQPTDPNSQLFNDFMMSMKHSPTPGSKPGGWGSTGWAGVLPAQFQQGTTFNQWFNWWKGYYKQSTGNDPPANLDLDYWYQQFVSAANPKPVPFPTTNDTSGGPFNAGTGIVTRRIGPMPMTPASPQFIGRAFQPAPITTPSFLAIKRAGGLNSGVMQPPSPAPQVAPPPGVYITQ